MKARIFSVFVLSAALLLVAPAPQAKRADEPDVVTVQHVLIGFKRSVPNKKLERTKKEAQALVEDLLARAQQGEDFDAMVKEYTSDSYPGIYKLTNRDTPLLPNSRQRSEMVSSFGDVAFSLAVGEVGMAKYHGGNSPYGWHLIKRLE